MSKKKLKLHIMNGVVFLVLSKSKTQVYTPTQMPSLQTPTSDLGFRVISRFSAVLEGMLLSCTISASLALNFDQLKKDYNRATH